MGNNTLTVYPTHIQEAINRSVSLSLSLSLSLSPWTTIEKNLVQTFCFLGNNTSSTIWFRRPRSETCSPRDNVDGGIESQSKCCVALTAAMDHGRSGRLPAEQRNLFTRRFLCIFRKAQLSTRTFSHAGYRLKKETFSRAGFFFTRTRKTNTHTHTSEQPAFISVPEHQRNQVAEEPGSRGIFHRTAEDHHQSISTSEHPSNQVAEEYFIALRKTTIRSSSSVFYGMSVQNPQCHL